MSFVAVFITVLMSIATAMMLEHATHFSDRFDSTIVAIAIAVFGINVLKFLLWGWIHRRYDLSKTYPIGTMFFPAIYVIAWWQGEAQIETAKLVGILFIIAGIILLHRNPQTGTVLR